ncbi:MAG TPA: hypothetical protein VMW40_04705 [Candidatus Bathyarchaeia archaeon]|nr:hypothetical protein [Candidatus Bathyarchaeia archaeon]
MECALFEQGFEQGSCQVFDFAEGKLRKACEATLKYEYGTPHRLINAIFLSRPEHYLSVYQSGCNLSCQKCHSWRFTQNAMGKWMSPYDMAKEVERYLHMKLRLCGENTQRVGTHTSFANLAEVALCMARGARDARGVSALIRSG